MGHWGHWPYFLRGQRAIVNIPCWCLATWETASTNITAKTMLLHHAKTMLSPGKMVKTSLKKKTTRCTRVHVSVPTFACCYLHWSHPQVRSGFQLPIWSFPKMLLPPNGWFIRENPSKMDDDWGCPHFRKPPYPSPIKPGNRWQREFTHGGLNWKINEHQT